MQNQIKVFDNLKVKEENGQVMFDAESAAIGLGITDEQSGLIYVRWNRVNKYLFATSGENVKRGDFITEPQFYKLATKANNETAEKFQNWVMSEVLPSICQTGGYQVQKSENPHDIIQTLLEASNDDHKTLVDVKDRVTDLEENTPLSAGKYSYISKRINQHVAEVSKGFGHTLTAKQRGELFKDINSGVKVIAKIDTRTQLRARHYNDVVNFITDREPSTATKTVIRQMSLGLDETA